MLIIKKTQMSDYLRKNLPDGFYLEKENDPEDDPVVKLKYGDNLVVAVFNQRKASPEAIVREAKQYLQRR